MIIISDGKIKADDENYLYTVNQPVSLDCVKFKSDGDFDVFVTCCKCQKRVNASSGMTFKAVEPNSVGNLACEECAGD